MSVGPRMGRDLPGCSRGAGGVGADTDREGVNGAAAGPPAACSKSDLAMRRRPRPAPLSLRPRHAAHRSRPLRRRRARRHGRGRLVALYATRRRRRPQWWGRSWLRRRPRSRRSPAGATSLGATAPRLGTSRRSLASLARQLLALPLLARHSCVALTAPPPDARFRMSADQRAPAGPLRSLGRAERWSALHSPFWSSAFLHAKRHG